LLCVFVFVIYYIAAGINIGLSLYNKLRLTGGLNLTDKDRIYVNEELEEKILNFEKNANINYERFRYSQLLIIIWANS